jgi:hypothetical protein
LTKLPDRRVFTTLGYSRNVRFQRTWTDLASPDRETRQCSPPNRRSDDAALLFSYSKWKELFDEVGMELADLNAAKSEAVKFAGEALRSEQPTDIWQGIEWG